MKVFITGATSGIGAATARKFAENGHQVWITGRRKERLEALATAFRNDFGIAITHTQLDVSNLESVSHLQSSMEQQWGAPDIIINNAGLALGLSTIDEGDIIEWDTMIDTNIKGLLYITRALSPLMKKQKQGHIFNIGSTAGKVVYPNGNVYCATKHAVAALSESMRIDLLPYNIKVTAVNPGMVDTEFSLVRFNGDATRAATTYLGFEPLHAADIADTIYYCATLPPHVCINDLTITCTRQANGIFKTTDEAVMNA
ncbi:MAG: SDR family NAD(P)-dependent oxidoreductase [Sphingobacteriales bacterium]|nr:MAG: SDR family NAD(P)-dependent oxidoreductase [Sphingobacteriales bacterium]